MNEPEPEVNKLIILSEFVFCIETNDIILEKVCNCRWNRFVIKLFAAKKFEIFVQNLSEIHKKASEINLSENTLSEILLSEIF